MLDNFSPHLSTKKDQRVGEWAAANNVELAYTPFYGSWLNWIEAQFQALRYFALDGTDHPSQAEQALMIRRYIRSRNTKGIAMARRGRRPVEITLTGNERRQLQNWARRHSSAQSLALRCKIILLCEDPELTGNEIAAKVGCNPVTVSKWRKLFAESRLDGLIDEPRPGAARTIGDDVFEQILIDTLKTTPKDATHWLTRSMAERHGISHQTVAEIWRAFGLKPWEQDEFKISPDPQLVAKIRDIVGLYMNPPVNAAVFAVDEDLRSKR